MENVTLETAVLDCLDQEQTAVAGVEGSAGRWTGGLARAAALGLLVVAFGLALAACQQPAREVPSAELTRAQAELEPFKEELLGALMAALEAGPANAIVVCRERAPEIAAKLSVGGVEMGRTSHRLRNPENAPRDWVEPLLAAYLADSEQGGPTAVWVDESTIGYVEPIRAAPFCISCHGPAVDPALLEEIRGLYPADQATGFRTGDLRGLFWLTISSGPPAPG